jgi:predicted trehalose synthase
MIAGSAMAGRRRDDGPVRDVAASLDYIRSLSPH